MTRIRSLVLAASLVLIVTTLPAQTPAPPASSSSPSLADTLNWLQQFLPNATGARYGYQNHASTTSNLRAISACEISLTLTTVTYSNGAASTGNPAVYQFSLGDIDPSTVHVAQDFGIYVDMKTRGNALAISEDLGPPVGRINTAEAVAQNFGDTASAQRAADAFKHGAELCANTQPF